jgi:arylsulfatase A-like enzyme
VLRGQRGLFAVAVGNLTGRTPHRNGVYTWIAAGAEVHLRTTEITLPKLLKAAGYATCHVGKWHLNGKFNDPAQTDPRETSDLSKKEPERLATLTRRLKELNAEIEKEGPDWWKRLSPNGGGPVKRD